MQVAAESFRKWENGIEEEVMDRVESEHMIRTCPVPFCVMWYINNGRYFCETLLRSLEGRGNQAKTTSSFRSVDLHHRLKLHKSSEGSCFCSHFSPEQL